LKSEWGLQRLKKTEKGELELSLYDDNLPEKKNFETAANRLSIAFPKMTKEFFLLLTEFVIKDGFTVKRLEDAVNHVISNFQYKELNISDIIKFDKRIKLYSYNEVVIMVQKNAEFEDFEHRKIDGKTYWVKRTDLFNANL